MKIRYKITDAFGFREIGEVVDAYLLNRDSSGDVALCFHPPTRGECGSFEFVRKAPRGDYWISAQKGLYTNCDQVDPDFKLCLKKLTKKIKQS